MKIIPVLLFILCIVVSLPCDASTPDGFHPDSCDCFEVADSTLPGEILQGNPGSTSSATVIFLTDPPGASVTTNLYSYPQRRDYLGLSGKAVTLDLERLGKGSFHEFYFNLPWYKEKKEIIPLDKFKSDGTNHYPFDNHPLHLEPVIPVLVPLCYFAAVNPLAAAAGSLVVVVTAAGFVFGFLLPRRRKMKKKLEHAEIWDTMATSIKADDPLFGRRFGLYRIVERIGRGGMGAVYRAVPEESLSERDSVAIKVLHEDISKDPDARERFKREMRISGGLNHPNILRVIEYGEQDGFLYLVMELLKGRTLRTLLRCEGLSLQEFLPILKSIVAGVEYAHGKGIVHRDLKPDNIMLTQEGRVVIMDFGLAKGQLFSTLTVSGTTFGTPAYMAPEQVTSGPLDKRADQYSLGVVIFHLLTGSLPFDDENPVKLMLKQVTEPVPSMSDLNPLVSQQVESVVQKMLEKDPEARFANLPDIVSLLEKALADEKKTR